MSLLCMHTWAPRDIRKLIISYLDTMSRAMVLAAHHMRWMWLIQNACEDFNSQWDLFWLPVDEMYIDYTFIHRSNKSIRKHKYMIAYASLEQLKWLRSENAFVPSFHMIGYAIACIVVHRELNVAQWLCEQTKVSWDDITIKNSSMPYHVFRYDNVWMLPFISIPELVHVMFKSIGLAILYKAVKILRVLCSVEAVTHDEYGAICGYTLNKFGDNHEIYKIVRTLKRVEYIIETVCVV